MEVGAGSLAYRFCPAKATWYDEIAELFEVCRLAMETGIMPKGLNLDDQDEIFAAALPAFVERWRERHYNRVWQDVHEFTGKVLEAVFGKK